MKLLSLCAKSMINYGFYKKIVTLLIVYGKMVLLVSIKTPIIFKTSSTRHRALILTLLKVFKLLSSNEFVIDTLIRTRR